MNWDVIDLWANIGSEDHWCDLPVRKNNCPAPFDSVYVPFRKRWPQPGFIGKGYFDSAVRVLVIGQNPRASNNRSSKGGDEEMFDLIRRHSYRRSAESLQALFSMMRRFMSGGGYGAPWGVVEDLETHTDLGLDGIAYLNAIPLATHGDRINLVTYKHAYERSTKLQLGVLKPHKILFHGKAPHDKFHEWERDSACWDTNYLERIHKNVKCDPKRLAEVNRWLRT